MKAKQLPALDRIKSVLEYDARSGVFYWTAPRGPRLAWSVAGHKDRRGYIMIGIDGAIYSAHRLAWLVHYGNPPPDGFEVDHANMDKSDNRIANLRIASRAQNKCNSRVRIDSMSGIKGVRFRYGRWEARIFVGQKLLSIGRYATKEDAQAAYARAARHSFGEFARANET